MYHKNYIQERLSHVSNQFNENGVDEFGLDPEHVLKYAPFFAWFYSQYFRTQVHGVDFVPSGRCLIVANHSGQYPLDAVMIGLSVFLERHKPRIVRSMVDKFASHLPFLSVFFERFGQLVGTPENCRRLLRNEESILVFPEGVTGITKLFHERYQLKPFGLGFMRLALEMKAPIVPACVIGAEEQAPAIYNMKWLGKILGVPGVPITPTSFLFPPLGLIPYPVKYRIYFGPPMEFSGDPQDEDAAIEPLVTQVKNQIRDLLSYGLKMRRHVFW